MAWKETRGTSRVALAAARHVAHSDDAKTRTDEATRLPVRSPRPRVLAGVGAVKSRRLLAIAGASAAVVVVVGGTAAVVAATGSDDPSTGSHAVGPAVDGGTDPSTDGAGPPSDGAEPTGPEVPSPKVTDRDDTTGAGDVVLRDVRRPGRLQGAGLRRHRLHGGLH